MALQTVGQGNVPEFIVTLEPEVRGDICEKRSTIRAVLIWGQHLALESKKLL
jgi:hypothetical protein